MIFDFSIDPEPDSIIPELSDGDVVRIRGKDEQGIVMRLEETCAYVNCDTSKHTGWYSLESLTLEQ